MTVHRIADSFVDDYLRLSPTTATALGVPGHDDRWPDLSPEGCRARGDLQRQALRDVADVEPAGEQERVAKAVFTERLGVEAEMHDAGLVEGDLNVLASPPQDLREVFDLMPAATAQDWATIATRLARMPEAVAGYQAGLRYAAERGHVSARRQVTKVADQSAKWGASFFTNFVAGAPDTVPASVRADLAAGAAAASQAYTDLAAFLRTELLPQGACEGRGR